MMKKILLLLVSLILVTGCNDMMNTPTRRVEEYLGKYQILDSTVLTELDNVVDNSDYSDEYKEEYKELVIKQYQNLSYKIKNEQTNGDTATVIVELEVFDYNNALSEAEDYIDEHDSEFTDDEDETKEEKIYHYKINAMKEVTDKASYTINFSLVKDNKKWVLEKISDSDLEKIHGLYED